MSYPQPIQNLIRDFSSLPGLGQKTAERLVFYLLKNKKKETILEFSRDLVNISAQIKQCSICGNYTEKNICSICEDKKRNLKKICLVAEAQDIISLEKTSVYHGLYHVLHGLLNPNHGIMAEQLNIISLFARLNKETEEIIFGFNPTMEGETTIIYLKKIISQQHPAIQLTKLSRGLPMGGDLEYADEITLSSALSNRSKV
jgi:recombination protein RecR